MLGKRFLIVPILTLALVLPSLGASTGNVGSNKEQAPPAAKPPAPAVKPPALKPPAPPAAKPPAPPAAKPPAPPVNPNYGKGNPAQNQVANNPLPPNPPQPFGPPPPTWQQEAAVFLQAVQIASYPGYIYAMQGLQLPGLRPPTNGTSQDSAGGEQREMTLKIASTVSVSANYSRPGGGSAYRPASLDVVDQDQDVTVLIRPSAGAAVTGNGWRLTGKVISVDKDGSPKQLIMMARVDASMGKIDPEKVFAVSITVNTPLAAPAK